MGLTSPPSPTALPPASRDRGVGTRIKSAETPRIFRCDFPNCRTTFPTLKQLKTHKEQDPDHEYCRKCDLNFPDWNSYIQHRYADPVHQDDKLKVCPVCGAEFQSHGGRTKHIATQHPVQHDITCVGCGKQFRQPSAYIGHIELDQCLKIKKSQLHSRIQHKTTIKKLLGNADGTGDSSVQQAVGGRHYYGATGSTVGLPERVLDIADMPIPNEERARQTGVMYNDLQHPAASVLANIEEEYPTLQASSKVQPKTEKKKKKGKQGQIGTTTPSSTTFWVPAGTMPTGDEGVSDLANNLQNTNVGWDDYTSQDNAGPTWSTAATSDHISRRTGATSVPNPIIPFSPDTLNLEFTSIHEWAQQVDISAPPPGDELPPEWDGGASNNADQENGGSPGGVRLPAPSDHTTQAGQQQQHQARTEPPLPPYGTSAFVRRQQEQDSLEEYNLFHLHFWDPNHPKFDVNRLYNRIEQKYTCPHPDCVGTPSSSTTEGSAIIHHLLHDHIGRMSYRCPECRRTFGSIQALVGHVTSLSNKCKIRTRQSYTDKLATITGGFVSAYESRRTVWEGGNVLDPRDGNDDQGGDINRDHPVVPGASMVGDGESLVSGAVGRTIPGATTLGIGETTVAAAAVATGPKKKGRRNRGAAAEARAAKASASATPNTTATRAPLVTGSSINSSININNNNNSQINPGYPDGYTAPASGWIRGINTHTFDTNINTTSNGIYNNRNHNTSINVMRFQSSKPVELEDELKYQPKVVRQGRKY